ncbi:MAG: hypothetical protein VXZ58_05455 [Actinomycetota bacterium]|nr:hypothetical protein [Actinomycetota bacterium]MEC8392311.1 hypothetical protein [Actinomycetota bacterium]
MIGKAVKIGNLVKPITHPDQETPLGIVVEVINSQSVPPVCKILWPDGSIQKEWTDDIEVINE